MTPYFRLTIAALIVIAGSMLAFIASATSTVEARWSVNRLKGPTQVATHTGATADEAWGKCIAAIPKPQATTGQTSGQVTHTCQTPKFVAVEKFSANPLPPVDCVVSGPVWSGQCVNGQEIGTLTIVTQPANGGAACPALTTSRSCAPPGILMSWTAPTQNTNGTPITNLKGYAIYYSRDLNNLGAGGQFLEVPNATAYRIQLQPGVWYVAVAAVNTDGAISALSNVVQRTVQ